MSEPALPIGDRQLAAHLIETHGLPKPGLNRVTTWAMLVAHGTQPSDHWRAQANAQEWLDSEGIDKQLANFHPCHWAKPFYSAAATFVRGAPRAFVGLNGAGDRHSHRYDKEDRNHERLWTDDGYNAMLDDRWGDAQRAWPPGSHSHQRAIQSVFKATYGDEYESRLRGTACFNIMPVSSRGQNDPVVEAFWATGIDWGIRLVEYLCPSLLILNGNGAERSAWSALGKRFPLREVAHPLPLENSTFRLREATITDGVLAGCRVVGLPHLSRNKASQALLNGLSARRPFV